MKNNTITKVNTAPELEWRILKVKGDGNCGPRALIQSLLVQGVLQNKKEWALNFIKQLINRTKEAVKNSYELTLPSRLNDFISQYETLSYDQLDNFTQAFFIADIISETSISNANEDLESITKSLDAQDESKLAALLNRFAPPIDNNARDDSIIYFLSACLRQDAASFYDTGIKLNLKTLNPNIDRLDNPLEIESIIPYVKHHKLQVTLHNINETEDSKSKYVYKVKEPELNLDITYDGYHFDVLCLEKDLDPPFSTNEEISKKIQIQKDEEFAKELQIKEIELFVSRNKNLSSQNSLAYINSFMDNLKLKDELALDEFSSNLYLSKNSTFIEQLIDMFKRAIINIGYSPYFKEEVKEQTRRHFTFFSTDNQPGLHGERMSDYQRPPIKCN